MLAIVAFGLTLWLARTELSRPTGEVPLRVDAQALADGFREGVSWHGLYREGEHVGFSRVERRREGEGFRTSQTLVLPAPGQTGADADRQSVRIVSHLDAQFVLRSFTVDVTGGPFGLSARGEVVGDALEVDLEGLPGGGNRLTIPLTEPPRMDGSYLPIATRDNLAPGDRFSFTHVDPTSLTSGVSVVEYVGREPLDVLGERVDALHLRQSVLGQNLDVWVNELGEVLRQTLPGGLEAVRESEAEATWGMRGEVG